MSHLFVRALGLAAVLFALASCSGPLFSKVQIKASPEVNAALGSTTTEISTYISVKEIRNMLKSSPDVQVFDYQPVSTDLTQSFLVHYPLTTVELDFGKYMEDLSLDSTLSQSLTPGTFKVPNLDKTVEETGTFDLNATLRSQVNGGFTPATTKLVETGLASLQTKTLFPASITVSQFTTATFAAGNLNLALSVSNASSTLTLQATKIEIKSGSTVITSSTAAVDVKAGGTVSLPLTGKTLPSTFDVYITVSTKGGTALKEITVSATPSLSNDVAMSGATGINVSTSITVPNVTIPVDGGGTLVSALVKDGSIVVKQGALPTGWTGFTRTTSISIAQSGGLTLASGAQTTPDISFDLAGKSITANDITVTASSTILATNASFSNLAAGPLEVGVDAEVAIGEFSEITVKPGADFEVNQDFNETLSDDLIDWVNYIDFNEVGIEFKISNQLPAGNPMTIVLNSDAFGIVGTPIALPSGQTASEETLAKFTRSSFQFVPDTVLDKTGDGKPDLDFRVTLKPNSYNAGTGEMVLYNIVPGTELSVAGSVNLISDWTKAEVSPPSGGYKGSFPSDDPADTIDLSTLKDYLGDKINFDTIDGYFYLSGPTATMTAAVNATYTDASAVLQTRPLITGSIPLATASPTFPATEIISTAWNTANSTHFTLHEVLNAKAADLKFDYDLNVSTLTVEKGAGVTQLRADLVLILPMKLVADAGATLDVGSALPEDDLFGRKAGEDNSGINDVLKNLASLSMNLAIDNKTGLGGTASLDESVSGFHKVLSLEKGVGLTSLTLTRSDIDKIINTVPFVLKLGVEIPEGDYSIQRGGGLTAKITVSAATDINQTIDIGGNN